jgi:death-on-curing protein
LEAHDQALRFGGLDGVRSLALIESAIARPYSGYYRTISKKAAALTQSLAKNHGFIDGNKRTTLIVVVMFITRSNYQLVAVKNDIVKEVENMILDVVEDRMSLENAQSWFRAHVRDDTWIRLLAPKKPVLR